MRTITIGLGDVFGRAKVLPLSLAPTRTHHAKRILLDDPKDEVWEDGDYRWRFRGGKLLRVMRYACGNPRKIVTLWQDDLEA